MKHLLQFNAQALSLWVPTMGMKICLHQFWQKAFQTYSINFDG